MSEGSAILLDKYPRYLIPFVHPRRPVLDALHEIERRMIRGIKFHSVEYSQVCNALAYLEPEILGVSLNQREYLVWNRLAASPCP